MEARFHSWRQQIKRHQVAIGVVIIVLVVVIALIIIGYWFDWTGFNGYNQETITRTISGINAGTVTRTEVYQPGKALWDWLQLLIIPFALAIIAIFFNRAERKNAQRLASDNQQEAALQEYITEMSELLLEKNLRQSDVDAEVRKVARVRTLTVLPRLDAKRKSSILRFLYESGLINKGKCMIDLDDADLSGAYLINANITRVDIHGANLSGADMRSAKLDGTDLSGAFLFKADLLISSLCFVNLHGANLMRANLLMANLHQAELIEADLRGAKLIGADLSGANLRSAKLDEADLSGAKLIGIDLHEMRLGKVLGVGLKSAEITSEQLAKAKSLKGATMPNGSIHR
jgi:uncharacterized protein YjbI with pentapeptide repeats